MILHEIAGPRPPSRGRAGKSVFDPSRPDSIETLEVVFKVAERCNINCSYCYYFNMGDTTALDRPAIVDPDVAASLGDWIAQGCRELGIPRARIAFHGGEPMLVRPWVFREICQELRSRIGEAADVRFAIQTNGTILNDEWLAIFDDFDVTVGVSIDGDRAAHDRYRLDRRGRSTFDATVATMRQLREWSAGDPRRMPSTISVLDSANDYRQVYAFLRSLDIQRLSFLLPDRNNDNPRGDLDDVIAPYGQALLDIFASWLAEDDPNVYIKFVHKALGYFDIRARSATDGSTPRDGSRTRKAFQVIVARSDGTVSIDDSYIPALTWYAEAPTVSIREASLRKFLSRRIFMEIEEASSTLPTGCGTCQWRQMCRGGDLENRWSSARGFDNPSVYCSAYKTLFSGMCQLLAANGYPRDVLRERFDFQESS